MIKHDDYQEGRDRRALLDKPESDGGDLGFALGMLIAVPIGLGLIALLIKGVWMFIQFAINL